MSNITVRKANVLLTVPVEQKEEYLNKGFDVVDSRGNAVIERAIPKDVNALSVMVQELQEEVKKLKEENIKLKAQLSSNEKPVEEPKEEEPIEAEESEESVEEEEEFTPINKRNQKKTTKK